MEQTVEKTIQKKKRLPLYMVISMILFTLNGMLIFVYFYPSTQQAQLNSTGQIKIYYGGNELVDSAVYDNEQLYIPLTVAQEQIDHQIYYDEEEAIVIISTDKDVYHFPIGNLEGYLNASPYQLTYPVLQRGDQILLPLEPLDKIYDLSYHFIPEQQILTIQALGNPVQQGITIKEAKLRTEARFRSPILFQLEKGVSFNIIREVDGWYWIETADGAMGYINKKYTRLTTIKLEKKEKEPYLPWNPIGSPIVLTWEYASKTTVNPKNLTDFPSLKVVSPTWFHLKEEGIVSNTGNMKYVDWAKQEGYQIWGLFSNSFDPELTHEMLNSPTLRMNVIKQLLSYVDLYQLDGINIDFENVNLEDRELLVQFVSELTPLMHEKERTVSMDVTFISLSENWSMFYDRKKLSEIVDYIIVMAYDEHWGSSPKAGSVASLPWVEKGVQRILEEVPNEKLILGIPFYTRLWIEEIDENEEVKVSSKAMSMEKVQEWIKEKEASIVLDEKSGQNYVEVNEENITYKIWIEDQLSIGKRVDIMKKYRLAGIASWRRGFESEEVWNTIMESINKR